MKRVLVIGDPHATQQELGDCQLLVDFIGQVARDQKVDQILFLGDLYNNHAIVHLDVMNFWNNAFVDLGVIAPIVALVGNHDMPGNSQSDAQALMAHTDLITVVDRPLELMPNVLYVPYIADAAKFVRVCNDEPTQTLIGHQTFDGSKYENGFFANDGVDQDLIPQKQVICGHIHATQQLGKVWYPGSPRWRTISDANRDKHINLLKFEDDGAYSLEASFLSPCRRIVHIEATPENESVLDNIDHLSADVRLDLRGPIDWVQEKKEEFTGKVKIRSFMTEKLTKNIKESDGIGIALRKHLAGFVAPNGTLSETLERMVEDRIGVI